MSWFRAFQQPISAFAATSLLAVAVGAVVCAWSGVAPGVWGRNLTAWVVGGLAAAALGRWARRDHTLRAVAVLTPLGVAAPMLGEGQEGVHRWLDLGPLYVNAAMLLLPAFVVALAVLAQRAAWWWIPAMLTLGALVLQPDASQATAFALALCVTVSGVRNLPARFSWGIALVSVALATLSWTRPDPLDPVAEVEEVIRLAGLLSPGMAVLSVLSLAAFAATPIFVTRGDALEAVRCAGRALGALLLFWTLAPAFGAFPVPLVGVGLSPILGAWLGIGLLAAVARHGGAAGRRVHSPRVPVNERGSPSAPTS